MDCTVSPRVHLRQLRAPRCQHARCKFHPSPTISAAASHKQLQQRVIIDIDAVVSGLHSLTAHWAFAAASSAFGGSEVPGSPQLYQRYLQQLLPVTHHPREAVLLIRLLADEGIVGARSASGREGPVVGRPVRHSGSRPLLIQEILEFWHDEIQPTCLLRWCRQMGVTAQHLQQRVDEEYCRAQDQVEWRLLDTQGICHGNSSCSGSSSDHNLHSDAHSSSRRSAVVTMASTVFGEDQPVAAVAVTATAADNRQTLQQQQQQQQCAVDAAPHIATAVVQPYAAVVQALISCQQQVYMMSTYPPDVTNAALLAAGLCSSSSSSSSSISSSTGARSAFSSVLQGRNITDCVQQQQQQQQQQADQALEIQPRDCSSSSGGGSQLDPACTWILSSPHKAASVYAALDAAAAASWGLAQEQQQQQQSSVSLQVGDWACVSPSLRAKALASPQMGLLSDIGLAELLGVAECDTVMDGIAWRR